MFKTRITEMLGIQYPIIKGGMAVISRAELVAAVSNAGGLGILISAHFTSGEELRQEIRRTKNLTNKPFGVNISLFPSQKPLPNSDFVDVIIDEKVAVAETSGIRGPGEFAPRLKKGGVKLIHKCAYVKHAVVAEREGADAVTVVGVENGGATGMEDVTTMVMVPLAVDAVKIPVLAGGGIGDARGLVAALALGAEGVVMGTRFMAVKESPLHPRAKEWMLRSKETDTVIVERSIRNTHRSLRNKATDKVLDMESKGATLQDLLPFIGGQGAHKVYIDGDLDAGMAYCGEVVGQINDIPTCQEVIDRMVKGAMSIRERLDKVCRES